MPNVAKELDYSAGVAKVEGEPVFIECEDGYNLRIPTTKEAVRRYNAFEPMKRALEHFAAGNEKRARTLMERAEGVDFFDTNNNKWPPV